MLGLRTIEWRRPQEDHRLLAFEMTRRNDVVTLDCWVDNVIGYVWPSTTQDKGQPTRDEAKARIGELERTIENAGENGTDPPSKILPGLLFLAS